jgi:hypothetical protein
MQVTRQHVVDILRMAALPELAEEANRVLPDPVEYDHADASSPSTASPKTSRSAAGEE